MKVALTFGALARPIKTQLHQQGLKAKKAQELRYWQHGADALTHCAVTGLIPETPVRAGRKRLLKRILTGIMEAKP